MSNNYSDEIIDNLVSGYYWGIFKLQNEEDILRELPEAKYDNFFRLIDGLIKLLKKDIEDYKETNDDDENTVRDIRLTEFKIELCEKRKREALSLIEEERCALQEVRCKNLIFATTTFGNIYFENDLKDIPAEFYDSILECMLDLINGNLDKSKRLVSNANLFGLYEVKRFKIRVIYQILDKDTVYVMMARMKKDTVSRLDIEEPADRKSKTEKEYKKIRQQLKDLAQKQKIILQNNEVRDKVLAYLEENKRGVKKNGK